MGVLFGVSPQDLAEARRAHAAIIPDIEDMALRHATAEVISQYPAILPPTLVEQWAEAHAITVFYSLWQFVPTMWYAGWAEDRERLIRWVREVTGYAQSGVPGMPPYAAAEPPGAATRFALYLCQVALVATWAGVLQSEYPRQMAEVRESTQGLRLALLHTGESRWATTGATPADGEPFA